MIRCRALLWSVLLAGFLTLPAPAALADGADEAMLEMLEGSLRDKKSVTLYLDGHILAGRVVRLAGKDAVELASREFGRILVRLESIHAVAVN
jgi:hypothetical protein